MAHDDSAPPDPGGPSGVDPAVDRPLDTVFELLADRRRRLAIYAFIDTPDGVIGFDDLTRAVARMEADLDPGIDDEDHDEHVAADLRHWHLPVLEDVGIVSYDERSEVVRYGGLPGLERWAERARADEGL